jgi:Spy/CpxP family protein refolding chaperone
MNRTTKTLLLAATLAGGLATAAAYAVPPAAGPCGGYGARGAGFGGPGMGAGMGPGGRIERMADMLDLTKEQRDKVRAIVDKARPETRALRDKLTDNRKQLQAATQQGGKDAEVRKLADAQGKLMADMIVLRTRVHGEISAVLTPAQREQLEQRMPGRGPRGFGGPMDGWSGLADDADRAS